MLKRTPIIIETWSQINSFCSFKKILSSLSPQVSLLHALDNTVFENITVTCSCWKMGLNRSNSFSKVKLLDYFQSKSNSNSEEIRFILINTLRKTHTSFLGKSEMSIKMKETGSRMATVRANQKKSMKGSLTAEVKECKGWPSTAPRGLLLGCCHGCSSQPSSIPCTHLLPLPN